jgi:uncharacterized membrane protein (UPF0182 family)
MLRKAEENDGEAGKLEEIGKAVGDLSVAFRLFQKLREMDIRRYNLDAKKLDKHIDFCARTHESAKRYLMKVREANPKSVSESQTRCAMHAVTAGMGRA